MESFLQKAIDFATKRKDARCFFVGAVGIRADGAVVRARNEAAERRLPCAHAEARLIKKLGKGSPVVYVARYSPGQKSWALAKPCPDCERALKRAHVKRVVFTTGPNTFEEMRLH